MLSSLAVSPLLPVMAADLDTSVSLLGQVPALMLVLAAVLGLVIAATGWWPALVLAALLLGIGYGPTPPAGSRILAATGLGLLLCGIGLRLRTSRERF